MVEASIFISLVFVALLVLVLFFILVCYMYIKHRSDLLLREIEMIDDKCLFMNEDCYLVVENYNNNLCDIFIISIYLKCGIKEKSTLSDHSCYHEKRNVQDVLEMIDEDSYLHVTAIDRKDTDSFMYDNVLSKCARVIFPNFLIFDVQRLVRFVFHLKLGYHVAWLIEFSEQNIVASAHSYNGLKNVHHSEVLHVNNLNNMMGKFFGFIIGKFNLRNRLKQKK